MIYIKRVLTLCAFTLWPLMTLAQTCQTANISASMPSNRFTMNKDGTVSDTKTGLTWKKCSEGQSGANCDSGNANTYTWQGALQQAQRVNNNGGFAGYKNWRLPNIKELNSIVEEQCIEPSINLDVFPNTLINSRYWTSSAYSNSLNDAWRVNFSYGSSYNDNVNSNYYIRLVR
jgi:hypothetical protein